MKKILLELLEGFYPKKVRKIESDCAYSSKMNRSSIVVFNALAIWCASMSEGLYLPFSR